MPDFERICKSLSRNDKDLLRTYIRILEDIQFHLADPPHRLPVNHSPRFFNLISLQFVLKLIQSANDFEINEIMDAVNQRYRIQFPDWDVVYFACPKKDMIARQRSFEYLKRYFP